MTRPGNSPRIRRLLHFSAIVAVILPCAYGFIGKFIELVRVYRGEVDGAFAIAPIINYLLASTGFIFLFGWAAMNGMFHDIEAQKQQMLDNESQLDARGPFRAPDAAVRH